MNGLMVLAYMQTSTRQLRLHPAQLVWSRLNPTVALLGSSVRFLPTKLPKCMSQELPPTNPPQLCPHPALHTAHPPPSWPKKSRFHLIIKPPSPHPRLTPTSLGSAPVLTHTLLPLWQAALHLHAQLLGRQPLLSPRPPQGLHPQQKFLSASLPGCCLTMTPVAPCHFLPQLA
jgi:hypothetical protein